MNPTQDVQRKARAVTYCSFADDRCYGVIILNGLLSPLQASLEARALCINPGGQLLSIACQETDVDVPYDIFEAMWKNRNRLIPPDEARELFEAKSLGEFEDEA